MFLHLDLLTPVVQYTPSYSNSINASVAISCLVRAYPKPAYVWFKDGVVIPDLNIPIMLISPTTQEDAGYYQCNVTNVLGVQLSQAEELDLWGENLLFYPIILDYFLFRVGLFYDFYPFTYAFKRYVL